MIALNGNDQHLITRVAEVTEDNILDRANEYTEADGASCKKLAAIGRAGSALVLTGEDVTKLEAIALLRKVVEAELDHWVPNSSQRLIMRAFRAFGFEVHAMRPGVEDCGPNVWNHALYPDWVHGLYIRRCSTCARLFRG